MKVLLIAVVVAVFVATPAAAVKSAKSENCTEAVGQTQKDLENALAFCRESVPGDLDVQAVMAMESLLWVKVSRVLANVMMRDKLTTEQVVKNWMAAWKKHSGSKSVTVHVEWQDVEIASGQTTLFSGDKVTVK